MKDKIDESRLLTKKELRKMAEMHTVYEQAEYMYVGRKVAKAQDAKTASIIRQEERARAVKIIKTHGYISMSLDDWDDLLDEILEK